jgi:hypothetical protein
VTCLPVSRCRSSLVIRRHRTQLHLGKHKHKTSSQSASKQRKRLPIS